MIHNQNEKNQFQPVPYTKPVEPIRTPADYYVVPGTMPGQQGQPVQPEQQIAKPFRLPIEAFDTRSLWAANPQEMPLQSPPSASMERVAATPRRVSRPSRRSNWKNKRRLGFIAALSLVVVCCLVSFAAWRIASSSIPDVTLYRVSMKSIDLPIGGGGITYPVQRLDISYPFAAHVLSVFVKPGDKVTLNQSLVQLDLSQVNAQNLSQLNAQVQQAYQDMISAQTYLNTVLSVGNSVIIAQARQQYNAALSRYQALQAEANAPTLHQGRLTSTLRGVVTAVNVYPGQELSANKVLLTIFDESSIIVRAQLPLSDYGQVNIKQSVQVTPSALPNQNYSGTVISIIPNANSQSGTFEVWAEVANMTGNLLPGMSTFVSIHSALRALVVPRMAVLNPNQDSIVFIVRQQHVYIQHVQVSGYTGDSVIIGSGLSANELIVMVGLDSLQDGQLVHIIGYEN